MPVEVVNGEMLRLNWRTACALPPTELASAARRTWLIAPKVCAERDPAPNHIFRNLTSLLITFCQCPDLLADFCLKFPAGPVVAAANPFLDATSLRMV